MTLKILVALTLKLCQKQIKTTLFYIPKVSLVDNVEAKAKWLRQ